MISLLKSGLTPVYHLSSRKNLPHTIEKDRNQTQCKKSNNEYLELIQEFDFTVGSRKIKISQDGQYIGVIGIYPPEFKLYDTHQLSLKFKRGFDSEILDFLFLSDDYRSDRYVEFHTQGGTYHKVRFPIHGRCLAYIPHSTELLVAGSSESILRLNLEKGCFSESIKTVLKGINCLALSVNIPIVYVAGDSPVIQVFDSRSWKPVAILKADVNSNFDSSMFNEITSLNVSSNGLYLALGTSCGICQVYDIRKDHRNFLPIVDIQLQLSSDLVLGHLNEKMRLVTADYKIVKVWSCTEKVDKTHFTKKSSNVSSKDEQLYSYDIEYIASLEAESSSSTFSKEKDKSTGVINSFCIYPKSGLIFIAQDYPQIGIYLIPRLGISPRWCSFLDSIIDDVEDSSQSTVYETFQFVTQSELETLGLDHLIGTSLLKAYMHGFFMDGRLYTKLKIMSQANTVEDLRKKNIDDQIKEKQQMRIQIRDKTPKVNKQYSEYLEAKTTNNNKASAVAKSLLTDNRFNKLFSDLDYTIENISVTNKSK